MQEDQIQVLEISQRDIVYNQDKATIDTMVATAKAYPRDVKRAISNSIAIVTMDNETAASCTYSLPRGGKPITGPSVHLARILVQNWGNIRAEAKVVDITDKHIVSQAVCYDIETNVAVKVEVRKSIMTKNGRMNDDMITVTGNAANAIAYRNAAFSVVPKAVVDKVYKEAQGLLTGDVSDEAKLIQKRNDIVERLKKSFGVTDEEILTAVGKSKMEYLGADEIVVLIGIGTSIKEGDTTVEQAFRPSSSANKPAAQAQKEEEARLLDFISKVTTKEQLEGIKDELVSDAEKKAYADKLKTFK